MSRGAQERVSKTSSIKIPNEYISALTGELKEWAYDEEACLQFKGHWRTKAFGRSSETPLDLEIGTGNGTHFAHYAKSHPDRCVLGIELKYKPLVQSIRRALRDENRNARICRYNAVLADHLFTSGELNDVIIHFPDPWEKLRQNKHRLIQNAFLDRLFEVQRPGSRIEFKTDSESYYFWAMEKFEKSAYTIKAFSADLHHSPYAENNFVTQFENIFLRKKQPIFYCELIRP